MSRTIAQTGKTWAEQWAELFPRPEWDNPTHWESARGIMESAQKGGE